MNRVSICVSHPIAISISLQNGNNTQKKKEKTKLFFNSKFKSFCFFCFVWFIFHFNEKSSFDWASSIYPNVNPFVRSFYFLNSIKNWTCTKANDSCSNKAPFSDFEQYFIFNNKFEFFFAVHIVRTFRSFSDNEFMRLLHRLFMRFILLIVQHVLLLWHCRPMNNFSTKITKQKKTQQIETVQKEKL